MNIICGNNKCQNGEKKIALINSQNDKNYNKWDYNAKFDAILQLCCSILET